MTEQNDAANERWAAIPEWEGIYSVSTLGRIRREKTKTGKPRNNILLGAKTSHGYRTVALSFGMKRRERAYAHRMVMRAFVGYPPLLKEVNHKDGNKQNNHLENLEYVTRSENNYHACRVIKVRPLHRNPDLVPRGSAASQSKLNEKQVLEIRELLQKGMTHSAVAMMYKIGREAISKIYRRERWTHI